METLDEAEMRDFEKAKAWTDEKEADVKMAEEMLKVKRNQ